MILSNRNYSDLLLPLLVLCMWCGMLWSRALLSISTVLFIVACFKWISFPEIWQDVRRQPYLWGMTLFFFVPMLSGLWSADKAQWTRILMNKMPLLMMPLVSLALVSIKPDLKRKLIWAMGGMLIISLTKAVFQYLVNAHAYDQAYLQAKVMPVDMSSDHVRYSWMLLIVFAWLLHLFLKPASKWKGISRNLAALLLLFIFIFLHLLASKTGLLGLYLVLFINGVSYWCEPMIKRLLILVSLAPVLAWALLPSFRNRMKFVRWDFQHYSRGQIREGLSDAPRVISWEAGMEIWKQSPLLGMGFGDILGETTAWYNRNQSPLKPYERLLPTNEFLLYASAGGLIGLLAFTIAAGIPFFVRRLRRNTAWISFHAIAILGFLYEIGLEVQYGVFLYAFLGCWMYRELIEPEASTSNA